MSSISVVTVTYNSSRLLPAFLSKLGQGQQSGDEIVLVDSGSKDIADVRLEAERFGTRLMECRTNVGFGAGTNVGVASSRKDWVAVVNPDVEVSFGQLRQLIEAADRGGITCIGPQVKDEQGLTVETSRASIRPPWRNRGRAVTTNGPVTLSESIAGCCMVMRRRDFVTIGGFDEYFFMFGEEIDLHKRITESGGVVGMTQDVTVVTPGGSSSSTTTARWSLTERDVAHVRFVRKHFSTPEAAVDLLWRLVRIARGGDYVPRGRSFMQLLRGIFSTRRGQQGARATFGESDAVADERR